MNGEPTRQAEGKGMYKEARFSEMRVGDSAFVRRTFTEADIANFAGVTGDFNPLHIDEEYARATRFKGRIAHGYLTASLITNVTGNQLPGPGGIYISQDFRFVGPVRSGDTITATVEIIEKIEGKRQVRLKTSCYNQDGKAVLEGEGLLKIMNE